MIWLFKKIDLILGWMIWIMILIPLAAYAYLRAIINKGFEKVCG